MKKIVITNKMQEVAVDILHRYIMYTWDGITEDACNKFYDEVYKFYELNDDPFTRMPCSDKEYAENNLKYQRQLMEDRFGYWE